MGCPQSKECMDDTNVDESTYVPMRKVLIIGDSGVGKTSIIFSLL